MCALALVVTTTLAGAASSRPSTAKISAHLTKTSFTSSQAKQVKLICSFSSTSKTFGYLLSVKNGTKWRVVMSSIKWGRFSGSKSMTVKQVFARSSVTIGNYRLKLSADGGSKLLRFNVVKGTPAGRAPTNTALPTISGTTTQGETLTASTGTWDNAPTSHAYRWRRCDSTGANCVDISSATSSTYVLVYADAGSTIRVVVTASNARGSSTASSNPTAVVVGLPPVNTALPAISGIPGQSQTLSASNGVWTNSPSSYAYQWRRCDGSGASCVDISGETSGSYVLVLADVGSTIRVVVTASNAYGSASATSSQTFVIGVPPANTVLPAITGTTTQGQTLTTSNGSWDNSPTSYAYQWQRCDGSGANCVDISSATSSTYVLVYADAGSTIRVVVTASSAYGSSSATSGQTAIVVGLPPVNTALPTISGSTTQGQTLTASAGSWSNSPTSYAYQWRRCDGSGASCVDISGETSGSYVLVLADIDSTIRVVVTASNAFGPSSATSSQTGVVGAPPVNTALPTISGTTTQGQTIAASTGSWTYSPTSYAYQWRRCDGSGANCADISGATSSSYVLVFADAGSTIRVAVTASNAYGTSSPATSNQTAVVVGLPPANTALPTVSGTATQGQTLTASNGSWSNSPTSYAYQWRRCDGSGASCADIASATSGSYVLVLADVDSTIRVVVTASNAYGPSSATSNQTSVVGAPPANTALPIISGTPAQGQTIAASTGSWINSPTSYTYQWRRCDSSGANCADIASATSSSYVLVFADVSSTIRVVVTASNAYGASSPATSDQTAVVSGLPPANTSLPTISGSTTQGQTLTASNGSWSSSPTSYTYQWRRCDSSGASCADISSATSSSYVLVFADVGSTIRVVVTASNAYGSASATSSQTTVVGAPPVNTALPIISGTTTQGQTIAASTGSWINSPTSYTYQWRRCDSSGANCADISSATSSSYVLVFADAGSTIRVVVTASNAYGSSSPAISDQTAVVAGLPPVNTSLPAISGTTTQGQTLTASNGSWTNSPSSYAYQWRRCDGSGASCADLSGETSSSYTLVFADAGSTIRVVVTASNAYGPSSATSNQTAVVVGLPPVNTSLPAISGTATQGHTLSASNGSWTNSPSSYAYQWRRCDSSGANCLNISSATSSFYVLVYADAGSTIRVVVTASNAYGPSNATSSQTAVVVGLPPANTSLPVVSGTTTQGQTLSTSNGTWTNSPTSYAYQWRRCDGSGANCVDILGETLSSYVLAYADAGSTVRVVVTASNAYGPTSATSSETAVVVGLPPVNTSLPAISGTITQGQTLTASNGSWTNSPSSYAYQWRRCNSAGASCSDIPSATASTYVLVFGDTGSTIRVVVTASNAYGSSSPATSAQTAVVGGLPPVNTSLPAISGTTTQGQTLSTSNGSWTNSPSSYAYQWRRCDSSGANCADISSATVSTYVLVFADAGSTIRVVVTASNAYGASSPATSNQTAIVVGLPPANTVLPAITGTTTQGQTLTASNGSWDNSPTSYAYQWRRCDSSGANCANISGETSNSYALVFADAGSTIRVVVTASNAYGPSNATSSQTAVVVGLPPVNTVSPAISGTTTQGQTLAASTGSWTNSPSSYAYQWRRCDSSGANCLNISSATSSSYVLVFADAGSTIRVVVTASNAYGASSPATSDQTAVVVGLPPVNTSSPAISGTTTQGQTLTAANGSWTNSPTSYAYQWRRCNSAGASCSDISSATSSTYVLVYADAGSTIRVVVTASNAYGSSSPATSAQTAVVVGLPPVNTSLPAISGTTTQGQTLTAANGSWTNSPTSYTYQWRRCDSSGANCADISSATSSSYVLVYADAGSTIRVVVTASNAYGASSPTTSDQTAVIVGLPPVNTAVPTVSGTAIQGQTLTASNGSWTNSPTSYTYQWRRCDSSGANCADISSATSTIYVLVLADVGSTIRLAVTASNAYGASSPATSDQTAIVGAPPANTALPTISGTTTQGQTLTASTGSWTYSPTSYAYQWRRCDAAGANCADISSATASTYVLIYADAGSTIRVVVTATNAYGSSSPATSDQTAVVVGLPPVNTSLPAISGFTGQGQTLTASNGSWTNSPTSYAYQWRRCNSSGASCADLPGETLNTYVLVPADIGSTIRVVVTATNAYGSSSPATSDQTAVVGLLPVNTAPPEIAGGTTQGEMLLASTGSWDNSPTSYAYQWRRCDYVGADCEDIFSATFDSYTLVLADVDSTIRVVVTASNASGPSSATSSETAVVIAAPGVVPAVSAGQSHSCAVLSSGKVNCWGRNNYGQLGDETTGDRSAPAQVKGVGGVGTLTDVTAISSGDFHTCALLLDRTVKCWGWNFYGQLGDGTSVTNSTTPVAVIGITTAIAINSGYGHTCALLADHTIECWGWNTYGQLGNGTSGTNSSTPVGVVGIATATAISAGWGHTCALLSDHKVKCWGRNSYGQVGDLTTISPRLSPTQVVGANGVDPLANVTSIGAGNDHTCAVLSNHTIQCWGWNFYGQLGDNSTVNKSHSVPVLGGITTAISINGGYGHTCAVLVSGAVMCWGKNTDGQLGDNSTSDHLTPVQVTGVGGTGFLSTVSAINPGYAHTCGILLDNTIKCWGYNSYGQLAYDPVVVPSSPVPLDVPGLLP